MQDTKAEKKEQEEVSERPSGKCVGAECRTRQSGVAACLPFLSWLCHLEVNFHIYCAKNLLTYTHTNTHI